MELRLRRFLHRTVADVSHYSGALPLRRFVRRKMFSRDLGCILGLHRVLKQEASQQTYCIDGMVLTEGNFVSLLEYLNEQFQVVPLSSLVDAGPASGGSKPLCALTFDDGWSDTYEIAYPWLKKHRMPATVFLTTDTVGGKGGFWIERLNKVWRESSVRTRAELLWAGGCPRRIHAAGFRDIVQWLMHMPSRDRQSLLDHLLPPQSQDPDGVDSMMTWDQAIEMSKAGIEIGAHTVTHPLLTYEDDTTVEYELRSSKRTLEEKLDKRVRTFAYPNGDWDTRVRRGVAQAGYDCAFTTQPGWYRRGQDPYAIERIVIHDGSVADASGRFSPSMVDWALSV